MSPAPIGSLLLGSSNVDAMKSWYRQAFDTTENEGGAFEFGPVQLFIEEHSEISGPTAEPARSIINLDVDDCRAIEAQLNGAGVTWLRPVELMPFGLIGTVVDPDGNLIQVIQWGATEDGG
ncbi:MAG: Glyoxalase/bleomycin resistance protein/dioxygenase [Actinomycetia bacterium]|nr:Glyoxalase/bleomycin resistance protein/dioxygenase [Actinomycetes bacterium]